MVRRFDTPETVAGLRKVSSQGDETYYEDCIVGIEVHDRGTLTFDFRNLRPIRINDRENLIVELDVSEVLGAIAEYMRAIKS